MILVDTNVWINHFRRNDAELVAHLNTGSVACHPYIIGELACGNLKRRREILNLLQSLPSAPVVEHNELLAFIEARKLMGKGLGHIDIHLLAAAVLAGIPFWTEDKRLARAAEALDVAYKR